MSPVARQDWDGRSVSGFESMQLSNLVENPTGAARMAALKRYHILDTDRDPVFDGITEIAAALLDAPIAVVNFIADDRQWFKAEIGIGQRELPLDVSICRIALPERGIFVVPDLACDGRFSRNPLVTAAEGLRFYAGTVLESEGVPIGTVCVLDTKPRPDGISDVQRRGLEALAVQAMAALERSAAAGHDRFKLALSEALLTGDDANDMMSVAARMIGEQLDVVQVGFGVVDDGGEYATVGQAWNDGRMPAFAGRWRLDDSAPTAWPCSMRAARWRSTTSTRKTAASVPWQRRPTYWRYGRLFASHSFARTRSLQSCSFTIPMRAPGGTTRSRWSRIVRPGCGVP